MYDIYIYIEYEKHGQYVARILESAEFKPNTAMMKCKHPEAFLEDYIL